MQLTHSRTHRPRRVPSYVLATLGAAALAVTAHGAEGNVDLPRFPAISPDGADITFTWRGDIWKASTDGGHAARLTSHPADDRLTTWSRDGQTIAFTSDRDGSANIYLMNIDGSDVRQVSNLDRPCGLEAFGVDDDGNAVITFSSTLEGDVYRSERPYMIALNGGMPMRIHDAFGSQPRVSPDGERVVFVRGGYYSGFNRRHSVGPETMDLWLYDRAEQSFTQLTDWKGHDGLPRWLDDDTIIFMSERDIDRVNLFSLDLDRGKPRRITSFRDRDINSFDVSTDGSTAVIHAWDSLYTLDLTRDNAKPKLLSITAAEDATDDYDLQSIGSNIDEAVLSPDGKSMAYVAYGEVYVRNIEDKSPTRRVTESTARDRDIAWSPDGLKLYFSSDRDGTESIYAATVTLTRSEIKKSFEKSAKAEDEDADVNGAPSPAGRWTATFVDPDAGEIDFALILRVDRKGKVTGEVEAEPYSGDIEGAYDKSTGSLNLTLTVAANDETVSIHLKLSDDQLVGAAVSDGVVIPINAKRDRDYTPKSGDAADNDEDKPELDPTRWHDAVAFAITPVVQTEHHDRLPSPSPDGTKLAFKRSRGSLIVLDLESGEENELFEHWDWWLEWRWSPDSRHIAFSRANKNFNNDIFIVPADGSAEPVNISRHPDNDGNPRFSADGRILSFISERINEEFDVWMVYLDSDLEALTPKELEEYYTEAVKAASKRKPVEVADPDEDDDNGDDEEEDEEKEEEVEEAEHPWELADLDDAWTRVRRVTSYSGNETGLEMTPGGDRYIFNGSHGQSGLYSIKWDGSDLTRLDSPSSVQHVSLTGDKVVYISGGRASTISPGGGKSETINIRDEIRIDLAAQASQKFHEMTRVLGMMFYHPEMKGVDWDALSEKYHELVVRTRTADEFDYVCEHMLGELTASHLGVFAAGGFRSHIAQPHGYLGTIHHQVTVDDGRIGFEVTHVLPDSPAAVGSMALEPGDVITAVDLEPFEPTDTVEARLEGLVGTETVITIERDVAGEPTSLNVLITPTSFGQFRQLRYKDWRRSNARLVEQLSDGRIGYIHIQGMNQPSLDVFERDLFAAASDKDGLIIDVRNNGGGWTTDRVLSSIMVREHAYTVPRGAPHVPGHYPQDRLFIQRYTLPINALCNEKSFSNAEIFSHAFRTLERGTLIGQETWGGVISTGGFGLIDGSFVRLPFRGWYVVDGTDMENQGAVPHLLVPQTPEAEAAEDDEQLRAGVDDLLKRLD